jgi:DNA-directed RNA polymerase subunit RPC12/RpoP
MPLSFRCVECGAEYDVADDLAGKTIRCKQCRAVGRAAVPQAPNFSYRCPFCSSPRHARLQLCWTPASTSAFFLFGCFVSLGAATAAIAVHPVAAFPVVVLLFIAGFSLRFRERQHHCPDCNLRI